MAINKHALKFILFIVVLLFFTHPVIAVDDSFHWVGADTNESVPYDDTGGYRVDQTYTNYIYFTNQQTFESFQYTISNLSGGMSFSGGDGLTGVDTSVTFMSGTQVVGTGIFGYYKRADNRYNVYVYHWQDWDTTGLTAPIRIDITTSNIKIRNTVAYIGLTGNPYGDKNAIIQYHAGSIQYMPVGAQGTQTTSSAYDFYNNYEYNAYSNFNELNIFRDSSNKSKTIIEIDGSDVKNETTLISTDLSWVDSNDLWNITMENMYGDVDNVQIDFSTVPPTPQEEDTILWDADSYVVGDTGSYSWSVSDDKWGSFFYTMKAIVFLDDVSQSEIDLPLQSGSFYYSFLDSGDYDVRLYEQSILTRNLIYTDTVNVLPIGPSYISVSETQITSGAAFEVEFSYGFTPSESYLSGVNAKRLMPDNTYAVEVFWSIHPLFPITANTLYNLSDTGTTPKLFQEGKYVFELVTFNEGVVAQSQLIDVVFVAQPPQYNITTSSITVDEASYKMGDTLTGNIIIDNTNFSFPCYLELYNSDYGFVTSTPQPIFKQITGFSGILKTSDYDEEFVYSGVIPALQGNNSYRIVAVNGTTRTVIAYDNFTISSENIYGYGLELSAYQACINEEVIIKVTAPSASNVTIENPHGNIVKIFVLNGSANIQFRFPTTGQYIIELSKSGDAVSQAEATILISDCADDGIVTPPTDGDMDDMYKNIFNFMTLPAFWGILIILGFVGGLSMKTNRMGEHIVSGNALAFITFALINLFCIVGLFAPYTMYILVSTWIFAGIFFGVGKMLARGE